ncbi:TetR/AcrR family transcriptional regulator [Curtobacterium sp. PsM8]|uniref:TetR/AcrR family transcriptional regulator n=1 Tax=Curtobacterium sp. PsM8 TaxID=3030532 RepID=UPI00263B1E97|nr:helix-turn-helix domain-containing protein [Curtobacterium sp. PsM8]MDN4649047.1 helix-turn-helix domain containing protein [Curtobacterium sp. PsM8]
MTGGDRTPAAGAVPTSRIRPTAAEIDEAVLDITAGLLARRGVRDTSVQAVADATGYSKTGLLGRFPTKEQLVAAALDQCVRLTRDVHDGLDDVADPRDRDAAAVAGLVDLALRRRGWAELVLASVPPVADATLEPALGDVFALVSDLFRIDADTDLPRRARVTGMLGALVVLALTHERETTAEVARPLVVAVCWSTLGHEGAVPSVP